MRTLARRFGTPAGELDLVMRESETVVFVEVKTQRSRDFADPQDRVTPGKQRKLIKAARWYVRGKHCEDAPCRFDVVSVIAADGCEPEIDYFVDAFAPRDW